MFRFALWVPQNSAPMFRFALWGPQLYRTCSGYRRDASCLYGVQFNNPSPSSALVSPGLMMRILLKSTLSAGHTAPREAAPTPEAAFFQCDLTFRIHAPLATLFIAHCSLLIVHCSLPIVHCPLNSPNCSLFIVHCSLLIAHCLRYLSHFKPKPNNHENLPNPSFLLGRTQKWVF